MGISFKVSKTGKRFNPKPLSLPPGSASFPVEDAELNDVGFVPTKKTSIITGKQGEGSDNKGIAEIFDSEVSFCLNLFPDGYSIAKPMESESGRQTSVDVPKFLHPYDRASETLFSVAVGGGHPGLTKTSRMLLDPNTDYAIQQAIESGKLPGDILDDIPCKYVNGALVCEVRDYRKCSPEGFNVSMGDNSTVINRVRLSMSLENIVKDIPAISDNDWAYGDLMEVESRILNALQPKLCLNPTSQMDKLSDNPAPTKLNLEIRSMRMKRLRQIPEVSVTSNNLNGKKICLDRVPESSRLGETSSLGHQPAYENFNSQNTNTMLPLIMNNSFGSDGSLLTSHPSKYPIGIASPIRMSSPGGQQDLMMPFTDNNVHGKRENQDAQSPPLTNKKARLEGNLQHLGPQMDGSNGNELHWKNTLMHQQPVGRGIQYNGMQKFSQQMFDGGLNPEGSLMPFTIGQGIRYNLKEEPADLDRLEKQDPRMTMVESELANIDPRLTQRLPAQFMRSGFSQQSPWNNLGQTFDNNNFRKEDSYQKRKLVQSPHVSAGGGLPQSPLSSKSGEFSSGSHQFGVAVNSGHVSQKEKSMVTSVHSVGANDSMQRQNQTSARRRSNSLPKTPAIGGVGSPVSVSNMSSLPLTASSPVGSQTFGDQIMLERFSKIEMVTMRCQLNHKKNKVDECTIRKANAYSAQELMSYLSNDPNNEILKDETFKLSKSLIAGNMNISKTRIMNFIQTERIIQGNSFQLVTKARNRMIMSEKPNDGAVAFHIGEIDEAEYLAAEDYLPTLPNTHIADLLAAQFCLLMAREGYDVEDHLQPKAVRINHTPPVPGMRQFSEGVSTQPPNDIARPGGTTQLNSPHNVQPPRMLPPGNNNQNQAIQIPPRTQQQPEQQLPPQQSQYQRSPIMLPSNPMQHLNSQLGAHMANKHSALQLQLLQQQQPQRKMTPAGLENLGMGNMGINNMAGLGGLNGIMAARGVGGNRIPASMGPTTMSSIGNINPASITNAIRNGTLTPEQAALVKLKMQQSRANMNMMNMNMNMNMNLLGGPQSSRQMHPGSVAGMPLLGSSLSRGNMGINQMSQRMTMGQMGPPKLMPTGMNMYMNQQQQQLQLQQQQQMQILQQHQQQMQRQQEAVVSPPTQVGSPSGSMGILHQMNQLQASPQQRTPMSPQLSSGGMHGMTGGNPEACLPASPQLSSQTMGSVGSIANSPMEM